MRSQTVKPPVLPCIDMRTLLSWRPCLSRAELRRLAAGRATITALEVWDLPISREHKLWMMRPPLVSEQFCTRAVSAVAYAYAKQLRPKKARRQLCKAIRGKLRWLDGEISADTLWALAEGLHPDLFHPYLRWPNCWSMWSLFESATSASMLDYELLLTCSALRCVAHSERIAAEMRRQLSALHLARTADRARAFCW